eukprot:SAG11_NODE_2193_length_3702_cov_6.080242_5_plen_81_part_00
MNACAVFCQGHIWWDISAETWNGTCTILPCAPAYVAHSDRALGLGPPCRGSTTQKCELTPFCARHVDVAWTASNYRSVMI